MRSTKHNRVDSCKRESMRREINEGKGSGETTRQRESDRDVDDYYRVNERAVIGCGKLATRVTIVRHTFTLVSTLATDRRVEYYRTEAGA